MKGKSFILTIIILISLIFTGCSNKNTQIINLQNELQTSNKKIQELQNNITILESDKKALEDRQNQSTIEINKKGIELIRNLKNMDSLSKIVDAYYYGLDAGPAEGYSDKLYSLYQKEGMGKLIEILNDKDETTIEGITKLLVNNYVFGKNINLVDIMIEKLNSINSSKLSDKKKYIILRLIERCYLVKTNINNN